MQAVKELAIRLSHLSKIIRSSSACERGVSILEFTIIGPFFVGLIIGVVDIGRMLNTYSVLTQVVHEAVRQGSAIPDLPSNTACGRIETDRSVQDCVLSSGLVHPVNKQMEIWDRVEQLLKVHTDTGELSTIPGTIEATVNRDDALELPGTAREETISVTLTGKFNGFFPLFDGMDLKVTASGPYLFRSSP